MRKYFMIFTALIIFSGCVSAGAVREYGLEKEQGIRAYDWWGNFVLDGDDGRRYMLYILIRLLPGLNSLYSISICPEDKEDGLYSRELARESFFWEDIEYTETESAVGFYRDDLSWTIKPGTFLLEVEKENLRLELKGASMGDIYWLNDGRHEPIINGAPPVSGFWELYSAEGEILVEGKRVMLDGWSCFEHLFASEYFWHGMHIDWVSFKGEAAYGVLLGAEGHKEGFIHIKESGKRDYLSGLKFEYLSFDGRFPSEMKITGYGEKGRLVLYSEAKGKDRNEIVMDINGTYYRNGEEISLKDFTGWHEVYRGTERELK